MTKEILKLQDIPDPPTTYDYKGRKQVGGMHYAKHDIQVFDIVDEYQLNFYEGNLLKYLLRYRSKNGLEDLEKAKHYLEIVIQRYKKELDLKEKQKNNYNNQ